MVAEHSVLQNLGATRSFGEQYIVPA